MFKQPAPAAWAPLPFEARLRHVASYVLRVLKGLKNLEDCCTYYQIGNETDYGVCGVFAGSKHKRMRRNINWLKRNIWRKEALVLKEAVKALRACSEKPVALHLGKTWDLTLLASFISTMNELDVARAFYPAGMGLSLDHLKSLKTLGERGGKAVAIAEYRTRLERSAGSSGS